MNELKTALSVGELVANDYRILGMAGAGGMGVVYRALDLKLERTVALKFLPADLNASERDKQRFLREARTASSLDHPNIGVIHGIEETPDGRTFIVMAYYEGQSLAQKIRGGPLPPAEAIDIALQMARGLAEAHTRHIVHRDIKPSNVMLTSAGSVRIVDFGLAHAATGQTASQTGVTGTVAYMSPEQTLGNTVDQRSDIWALGLVLAEMLTGHNPVERESIPGIIMAILNEAPRGLDELNPELQSIVYRALSKQPAKRYQSCAEVIADLEQARALPAIAGASAAVANATHPGTSKRTRQQADISRYMEEASRSAWSPVPVRRGPPAWVIAVLSVVLAVTALMLVPAVRESVLGGFSSVGEKHVAVLPFDNIGSNPENDVLMQGLMDSMAGKLSNLDVGNKLLWVVPASEVRRKKITDPSAALKELGATLAVKGSIERDGQAVHMNVSLIDTKKMRQVGSADVEDQAGDLSMLQNEAVSRLAKLMNLSVSAEMLRTTGGDVIPAAYEGYLKALGYMQRYDKAGNLDLAIAALNQSIKTDPRFALGYGQLGEAYRLKYQVDQNAKWLDEAQAYGQKAVKIDNRMPAAYVTLGEIHNATGKHDLALQEFHHALDIDPRNATALNGLSSAYESSGRIQDAEAARLKAVALRPDNWDGYNSLGNFYDRQSKYPEAIKAYRKGIDLTPDNAQVYLNLGATYLDAGDAKDFPAAEQALKKSIELSPSYPAYANLSVLYSQERRYADAAAAARKALELNDMDYRVWKNLLGASEWLADTETAEFARKRILPLIEQAAALKPQDAIVQSDMAWIYAQAGEPEKALSHVETSLALAPDDPNVLSNVATAYEIMHNRRRALEYVQRALQKDLPLEAIANDPAMQQLLKDPNLHRGKP